MLIEIQMSIIASSDVEGLVLFIYEKFCCFKCYCFYIVELTNCKPVLSSYFVRLFVKVQRSKSSSDLPNNFSYSGIKNENFIVNTENILFNYLKKSFSELK